MQWCKVNSTPAISPCHKYRAYTPKFPGSYITAHACLSVSCHTLQHIHTPKLPVSYITRRTHLSSPCYLLQHMHALVSHVIYYSTYIPKFPVSYITTHTHLSSPCHVLQYIHTKFHVTYIAGHAHLSSSCHLSSSYYNTYTPKFFLDFFCCQHKFHRRRPASCAERESKYLNVSRVHSVVQISAN